MKKERTRLQRTLITVGIVVGVIAVLFGGFVAWASSCSVEHEPDLNYPADASREEQIQYVMDQHLIHEGCTPVHNFVLYLENEPAGIVVNQSAGIVGRTDDPIDPDAQYRIASITKTFVATVALQLVEEGKLSLDDPVNQYIADIDYLRWDELMLLDGQNYADEITVDELLQHRAGMADVFVDTETRFILDALTHPHKLYTTETIMDKFFQYGLNEQPHFKPGEGYYYSDFNYVLLGLTIEQVTGKSLPENIRERIIEPLELDNTYFEFYEPATGNGKRLDSYLAFINIDKNVYTSYEWAGGGIVSTTEDTATFIKALFAGELFENPETLDLMLDNSLNAADGATYARGINTYDINGVTYYGHGGFYGSLLLHNPETGITFSAHMGQAFSPYNEAELKAMIETLVGIVQNED